MAALDQGLNLAALERDMASDEIHATIAENIKLASAVGISGTPGYVISEPMRKLGWRASDTRELSFQSCAVPEGNLLGERGRGFQQFLEILDGGRISVAAMGLGLLLVTKEAGTEGAQAQIRYW